VTIDFWDDADIISTYSRAQALEDGVLVDLNRWISVNESGYKWPIACTSTVFGIIEAAVKNKGAYNDYKGVIWDILWMSKHYQVRKWETGCLFEVKITGIESKHIYTFKLEVGPGDTAEPVITIMMPDED
jgi:hypothetical protein